MKAIEIKAVAKINLSLDVVGKRPDGYHDLRMIMQTIGLHDTVCIERCGSSLEVVCGHKWVPDGCENIAYKAAELLMSRYDIKDGVKIHIAKKIPVAAGLAGGSTNAAAVMKGINSLFSLGIDERTLMDLGKQIGADVPYCIRGGTMLAEGIGEILTPLVPLPKTHLVLVKPKIGVSTAWVYKILKISGIDKRPDTDLLVRKVNEGNIREVAANMKNVLETVTVQRYKVVGEAKQRLMEFGAYGSMMSGSGPSVFGIFGSRQQAEKALGQIESNKWESFLTYTV